MPNHYKNRNNKSHKSTSSTSSTVSTVNKDEDGFSGLIKIATPSSRRSTPKNTSPTRADFMEPLSPVSVVSTPPPPPPSPWDLFGMTEQEFISMQNRVFQRTREVDRQIYVQNMLDDLDKPSYWLRRIEHLEKDREYFNKKRGWSAADIVCVERIDDDILECESELDRIYADEDRIEAEYD